MTEMIESLPEQIDRQQLAAQLVEQARAEGVDLVGPHGLLTGLTKTVLETALEAGRNGGNSRNGTRSKTVLTQVGAVQVDVPRDRDGTFEPVIVRSGNAGWTASTRSCCR